VVVRAFVLCVLAAVPALVPRAATFAAPAPGGAARGVSATKVSVGGLLSADPTYAGADLGARARFARAGRIAGRTIDYTGAASAADAGAVTQLASTAFAVVPVLVDGGDSATVLARAGVPFVGIASEPDWRGNRLGFGITGSGVGPRGREANPAWGAQLRSLLGGARGKTVVIVTDNASFVAPTTFGGFTVASRRR
jgi:branched-chain amino acid transport system substrate-binding protein